MRDKRYVSIAGLKVGDRVWFRGIDGVLAQATVAAIVRGRDGNVIGFHPTSAPVDPAIAIPVGRIERLVRAAKR